ncbi:unnamed protein product, partial [Dibothriocephalus latus]
GSSEKTESPTSLPQSAALPPRPGGVESRKHFVSSSSSSAASNADCPEPRCEADNKSDTEDDFELIEVNGKRDGSGPDLSRQVAQTTPQVCQMEEPYEYLPSSEWATTLLNALSEDDKSISSRTGDSESSQRPIISETVGEASKSASPTDAGAPLKASTPDSIVSTDKTSPSKTIGNGLNNNLNAGPITVRVCTLNCQSRERHCDRPETNRSCPKISKLTPVAGMASLPHIILVRECC